MPKTDAEWVALAARLAKEVMGLTPDEFFDDGTSVWWVSDKGKRRFLIAGFVDQPVPEYADWQPHLDIAQAVLVLDAIVAHGADASLKMHHHDPQREAWLVPPECRGPCNLGLHDKLASAICLAAEAWLDRKAH